MPVVKLFKLKDWDPAAKDAPHDLARQCQAAKRFPSGSIESRKLEA